MTSSATSTDRPAPGRDTGFHPWHFFILLSMIGATAAVMLARDTHPVALLLLSAAVIASGLVALALHHAVAGFFSRDPAAPVPTSGQLRETLARDKALVLRSIKELEFDRAMGKMSEKDFEEMSTRLKVRAARLIRQLDADVGYRGEIEREIARRVRTGAPAATDAPSHACATCSTVNDADARFCKNCGAALGQS